MWPVAFEAAPQNELKEKILIERVVMKREMGLKVLSAVALPLGLYVNFG